MGTGQLLLYFGREVNLSAAKAADANAGHARFEAAMARAESSELKQKANEAQLAAAETKSKELAVRAAVDGTLVSQPPSTSTPTDIGIGVRQTSNANALKAILDRIYGMTV
jgi:hypothetical protein